MSEYKFSLAESLARRGITNPDAKEFFEYNNGKGVYVALGKVLKHYDNGIHPICPGTVHEHITRGTIKEEDWR